MTTPPIPITRSTGAATFAVACLLALPLVSHAKDHDDDDHGHKKSSKHHSSSHHDDHDDHDRERYMSHSHSGFTLSLGTGYAGRGYYYGPPHSSYYFERPEVHYYATREAAPREYYGDSGGADVQRALARRGFYHGSIDGDIGPQSRRAIARYQDERGLRVTGTINSSLLRSLGLD